LHNSIFIILILCFLSLKVNAQKSINYSDVKETHMLYMLNFLCDNNYYDEIGKEYVYSHYKDATQGFFILNIIPTSEYGIHSYHFYSGEAHAAEFIMITNLKGDEIIFLGFGNYQKNKNRLINFINNNVVDLDKRNIVSSILLNKLDAIYPYKNN